MSATDVRRQADLNDSGGDGEHDGRGDQPARIDFVGIRGGQGTSTVAAATALLLGEIHGRVRLESHDLEGAAALLGAPSVVVPTRLTSTVELARWGAWVADGCWAVVSDLGLMRSAPEVSERAVGDLRIGVLRGPCYVALRTLVGTDTASLAGLVLCLEAGRALDRRDVEDIAGLPVLATADVTPAVARTLDAGLAATRLARMREFAEVRRWLTSLASGPSCGPDRLAPGAVAFRPEPVEKSCTDWHLPPGRKVPSLLAGALPLGRSSEDVRLWRATSSMLPISGSGKAEAMATKRLGNRNLDPPLIG